MTDRIMECITNPVKCKLLLEIYSQGQATARHLADAFGDIPQATLYRNLKKMLNDGILKVVEETQIRGTVEKTYGLAFPLMEEYIRRWVQRVYHSIWQLFIRRIFQRYFGPDGDERIVAQCRHSCEIYSFLIAAPHTAAGLRLIVRPPSFSMTAKISPYSEKRKCTFPSRTDSLSKTESWVPHNPKRQIHSVRTNK